MASRTAVTENRRKAHHRAMGAKRKAANRNKGTTPKFAVHENGAPKVVKAEVKNVPVLKAPSMKKAKVLTVKAPKAEKAPKAVVAKVKAPKAEKTDKAVKAAPVKAKK